VSGDPTVERAQPPGPERVGGPWGGRLPTAGPPATPPPPPPRRRAGLVVALVVALLAAVGAGGMAWQQRQVAAAWRDRAEVMQAARDDARGRTEALQRQLDEASEVLAISEQDVAQLEARIRALADEKAQAEDTATTVQVERDVFVQLSTTVAGAVDALDVCVTQLFSLLDDSVRAFNDAAAGRPVDVVPLNAAKDATTAFCNEARTAAASAGAAADRLLR
jgi:hypothetical protein